MGEIVIRQPQVAQIVQSEMSTLAAQGIFTTIPSHSPKSRRAPRAPTAKKKKVWFQPTSFYSALNIVELKLACLSAAP
jgi:hypothetical protein